LPNPKSTSAGAGRGRPEAAPDRDQRVRRGPQEKLARILESGSEIFAERGYHAATIHEICARARVSVGTYYSHFDDKRELIAQIIDTRSRTAMSGLAEWNFQDVRAITAALEALVDDPVLPGLWRAWREAVLHEDSLRPIDYRTREIAHQQLGAAIERSRQAAALPGDARLDHASAAWAILALVREVLVNPADAPRADKVVEAMVEIAFSRRHPGVKPRA
jgi:AcrR family transcriptional regulator